MRRHALFEHVLVDRLAGTLALGHEPRDHLVAYALLDGGQRCPDERRGSVLQERAKDERVLRRCRALELAPRPFLELRRRCATLSDRCQRDAADELVAITAKREQLVRRQLALRECRDRGLEGLVVLELVRVELVGAELGGKLRRDLAYELGELALLHLRLECARSNAMNPNPARIQRRTVIGVMSSRRTSEIRRLLPAPRSQSRGG